MNGEQALREALERLRDEMKAHQQDIVKRSNNQKGRARNRTRRYSAAMEGFIRQLEAALAASEPRPIGDRMASRLREYADILAEPATPKPREGDAK